MESYRNRNVLQSRGSSCKVSSEAVQDRVFNDHQYSCCYSCADMRNCPKHSQRAHSLYQRVLVADTELSKWMWWTQQHYLLPGCLGAFIWVCLGRGKATPGLLGGHSTNVTAGHRTQVLGSNWRWLLSPYSTAGKRKGKECFPHCVPSWSEFSDKAPATFTLWVPLYHFVQDLSAKRAFSTPYTYKGDWTHTCIPVGMRYWKYNDLVQLDSLFPEIKVFP